MQMPISMNYNGCGQQDCQAISVENQSNILEHFSLLCRRHINRGNGIELLVLWLHGSIGDALEELGTVHITFFSIKGLLCNFTPNSDTSGPFY